MSFLEGSCSFITQFGMTGRRISVDAVDCDGRATGQVVGAALTAGHTLRRDSFADAVEHDHVCRPSWT